MNGNEQAQIKNRLQIQLLNCLDKYQNGRQHKQESLPDLLNCTMAHFMKYLESQFTDGMSWDNRVRHG